MAEKRVTVKVDIQKVSGIDLTQDKNTLKALQEQADKTAVAIGKIYRGVVQATQTATAAINQQIVAMQKLVEMQGRAATYQRSAPTPWPTTTSPFISSAIGAVVGTSVGAQLLSRVGPMPMQMPVMQRPTGMSLAQQAYFQPRIQERQGSLFTGSEGGLNPMRTGLGFPTGRGIPSKTPYDSPTPASLFDVGNEVEKARSKWARFGDFVLNKFKGMTASVGSVFSQAADLGEQSLGGRSLSGTVAGLTAMGVSKVAGKVRRRKKKNPIKVVEERPGENLPEAEEIDEAEEKRREFIAALEEEVRSQEKRPPTIAEEVEKRPSRQALEELSQFSLTLPTEQEAMRIAREEAEKAITPKDVAEPISAHTGVGTGGFAGMAGKSLIPPETVELAANILSTRKKNLIKHFKTVLGEYFPMEGEVEAILAAAEKKVSPERAEAYANVGEVRGDKRGAPAQHRVGLLKDQLRREIAQHIEEERKRELQRQNPEASQAEIERENQAINREAGLREGSPGQGDVAAEEGYFAGEKLDFDPAEIEGKTAPTPPPPPLKRTYRELQARAKELGIKANQKAALLEEAIAQKEAELAKVEAATPPPVEPPTVTTGTPEEPKPPKKPKRVSLTVLEETEEQRQERLYGGPGAAAKDPAALAAFLKADEENKKREEERAKEPPPPPPPVRTAQMFPEPGEEPEEPADIKLTKKEAKETRLPQDLSLAGIDKEAKRVAEQIEALNRAGAEGLQERIWKTRLLQNEEEKLVLTRSEMMRFFLADERNLSVFQSRARVANELRLASAQMGRAEAAGTRGEIGSVQHIAAVREEMQLRKDQAYNKRLETRVGRELEFGKIGAGLMGIADAFETVSKHSRVMFAGLTASMLGFLRAGSPEAFQTVIGNFQLLAGTIGNYLVPHFITVADWFGKVRGWFNSLSESTKEGIAQWIMWGATALGAATALGLLSPAIRGVVTGVKVLIDVLRFGPATIATFVMAHPWLTLAAAVAAVAAAVGFLTNGFGLLGNTVRNDTQDIRSLINATRDIDYFQNRARMAQAGQSPMDTEQARQTRMERLRTQLGATEIANVMEYSQRPAEARRRLQAIIQRYEGEQPTPAQQGRMMVRQEQIAALQAVPFPFNPSEETVRRQQDLGRQLSGLGLTRNFLRDQVREFEPGFLESGFQTAEGNLARSFQRFSHHIRNQLVAAGKSATDTDVQVEVARRLSGVAGFQQRAAWIAAYRDILQFPFPVPPVHAATRPVAAAGLAGAVGMGFGPMPGLGALAPSPTVQAQQTQTDRLISMLPRELQNNARALLFMEMQPRQIEIEALHDIIQNESIRSEGQQELMRINLDGFRKVVDAIEKLYAIQNQGGQQVVAGVGMDGVFNWAFGGRP